MTAARGTYSFKGYTCYSPEVPLHRPTHEPTHNCLSTRLTHPTLTNCFVTCYIPLIRSQSFTPLPLSLPPSLCTYLPLSLYPSLSLSLPLPLSLYLSGVAMTCLGFDVSVCIVTEAMLPPTSRFTKHLFKLPRACVGAGQKKRGPINSYFCC